LLIINKIRMKKKLKVRMFNTVSRSDRRWRLLLTKGLLFLWIIFSGLPAFAQNTQTISGKVVDNKGEALPGVSIVLKNNAMIGAITDADGNFSLTVPPGKQTLTVSFLGMATQEIAVTGTSPLNIVMKEDTQTLGEVVVVGFGTQKKESVVGAITQTSGKILERAGGVSDLGMALTGNLPGVTTMSTTGMPGEEDPSIVIRGRSSWNNSEPLVLVDGIERPMSTVDINSVENISVLKDASATAIFGVRGANGVILITTKRGQEGKADINFNFSSAMKSPSRLPAKYDSYDALNYLSQAIENELAVKPESWGAIYPNEIISKFRNPVDQAQAERYPNIDWQKETLKDYTMSSNANMNISGGTKFVKYFANFDYSHEGDIYREIENNRGYTAGYGYDRINVRSNLDFNLTPSTTFKVGLSGSSGMKKGPEDGHVNVYTAWTSIYFTAPDAMYPHFSDGSWGFHAPNSTDGSQLNPLYNMALRGIEYYTTNRINTDFTLKQDLGKILKGLSAQGMLAIDNQWLEYQRGVKDIYESSDPQQKYIDPRTGAVSLRYDIDATNRFDYTESVLWYSRPGTIRTSSQLDGVFRRMYYSAQLNYANTFNEVHNLTAMGNFSREEKATGNANALHREDWVFRVTYDYARRYLLEYNGSYNGSDLFAKENRFAFFQSGALGWNISEEPLIQKLNLNWLDMLKVRTSYGKIGDDYISPDIKRFPYMTQWDLRDWGFRQSIYAENSTSAYKIYYESVVGNSALQWETVEKYNLGIDYGFFHNLLSGSVEFYKDKRHNVFIWGDKRAMSSYFGASPPNANLGAVDVNGLEVELRLNKNINRDLRLWGNIAYTHAKDLVIERDDPQLSPAYQKQASYAIDQPSYFVNTGYINNWDELYGSTAHDNLDEMRTPGSYILLDYNADGVISSKDQIPYSFSRTPQNTFNTTLGVDYKGFSFFIQFYGVNNVTREAPYTSLEHSTRHTVYEYQGSYWTKDNQNADWAKLVFGAAQSGYATSTRYDFDASYLRLKNVELGYTFSNDMRWVRKAGIKNLKLYINGNNLWLYSHMPDDRETNGNIASYQFAYPTMKRLNLGLRISL